MAGWRGVVGVWPALLVCGGSFALVQFLVANYHGPWLVDVAGGVVSLVCLALFLRFWQPRETLAFCPTNEPSPPRRGTEPMPARRARQVVSAWVPWAAADGVRVRLGAAGRSRRHSTRDRRDWRGARAAPAGRPHRRRWCREPKAEEASLRLQLAVGHRHRHLPRGRAVGGLAAASRRCGSCDSGSDTVYRMRWPLFTIACMLAIAFTTRYSGMDATLGLAFTRTGWSIRSSRPCSAGSAWP